MARNMPAPTRRSTVMNPSKTETIHDTPRIASSGQSASPTTTPSASGQAALNPPESARAVSASQTGPGVKNRMTSAPA